jgi:hypothetical protein
MAEMMSHDEYVSWRDEVAESCSHNWIPFDVAVEDKLAGIPTVRIRLLCRICCGFTYQTYAFIGRGLKGCDDKFKGDITDGKSTQA